MTRKFHALEEAGRAAQRELLLKTLKDNDWSYDRAAKALGVGRNLAKWIRSLGLTEEYRAGRASIGKPTKLGAPRTPKAAVSRWDQVPMFDDPPA